VTHTQRARARVHAEHLTRARTTSTRRVMLIISGFLLMAAGLFVAVSMMLSEERHQPAYIENTPGSCSGSYLVNQGGFLQPLWDAIARVQKQLS
jgi:NADH:ubiquinone oxidoreductase subunit H